MAEKKKAEGRDVFETAFEKEDAWRQSPEFQALEESRRRSNMGALHGGIAGVAAYLLGRKAVRSLSKGRLAKKGDMYVASPIVAAASGGAAGAYLYAPERYRRKKK